MDSVAPRAVDMSRFGAPQQFWSDQTPQRAAQCSLPQKNYCFDGEPPTLPSLKIPVRRSSEHQETVFLEHKGNLHTKSLRHPEPSFVGHLSTDAMRFCQSRVSHKYQHNELWTVPPSRLPPAISFTTPQQNEMTLNPSPIAVSLASLHENAFCEPKGYRWKNRLSLRSVESSATTTSTATSASNANPSFICRSYDSSSIEQPASMETFCFGNTEPSQQEFRDDEIKMFSAAPCIASTTNSESRCSNMSVKCTAVPVGEAPNASLDISRKETSNQILAPESSVQHLPTRYQFRCTKLCPFHLHGGCLHPTTCTYAHCQSELRPLPDLHKTKLCEATKRGAPCFKTHCTYAHSFQELKSSSDLATYKTSLCFFWKKGRCLNGIKCRFAHGVEDLRSRQEDTSSCRKDITAGATLVTTENPIQRMNGLVAVKRSDTCLQSLTGESGKTNTIQPSIPSATSLHEFHVPMENHMSARGSLSSTSTTLRSDISSHTKETKETARCLAFHDNTTPKPLEEGCGAKEDDKKESLTQKIEMMHQHTQHNGNFTRNTGTIGMELPTEPLIQLRSVLESVAGGVFSAPSLFDFSLDTSAGGASEYRTSAAYSFQTSPKRRFTVPTEHVVGSIDTTCKAVEDARYYDHRSLRPQSTKTSLEHIYPDVQMPENEITWMRTPEPSRVSSEDVSIISPLIPASSEGKLLGYMAYLKEACETENKVFPKERHVAEEPTLFTHPSPAAKQCVETHSLPSEVFLAPTTIPSHLDMLLAMAPWMSEQLTEDHKETQPPYPSASEHAFPVENEHFHRTLWNHHLRGAQSNNMYPKDATEYEPADWKYFRGLYEADATEKKKRQDTTVSCEDFSTEPLAPIHAAGARMGVAEPHRWTSHYEGPCWVPTVHTDPLALNKVLRDVYIHDS